jgi:hypothetical protein
MVAVDIQPRDIKSAVPFKIVAIEPGTAAAELYAEVECLLRFWRRRCFYCFIPCDSPPGETDFQIDMTHLAFALSKVSYYQELLDSRDKTPEAKQP